MEQPASAGPGRTDQLPGPRFAGGAGGGDPRLQGRGGDDLAQRRIRGGALPGAMACGGRAGDAQGPPGGVDGPVRGQPAGEQRGQQRGVERDGVGGKLGGGRRGGHEVQGEEEEEVDAGADEGPRGATAAPAHRVAQQPEGHAAPAGHGR